MASVVLSLSTEHVAFALAVTYGGGDGRTMKTAIIVMGATNEQQGILAENAYVAQLHPDWRSGDTALFHKMGHYYDYNMYFTKNGSKRTLIFDVTEFFSKTD